MLYYLKNNNKKKISVHFQYSHNRLVWLHNTHQQQGNIFLEYFLSAIGWIRRHVTLGTEG